MKQLKTTTAFGLLPILLVLSLTVYFTVIIMKYPLVGMEVTNKDDQWIIETIYEKGWASDQPIEEGDIIAQVNGKEPREHATIAHFSRVEMVTSVTIKHKELQPTEYLITYNNLDSQYLIYLIVPFLFTITTVFLSVFLYRNKREDRSAIILIYFLLSLGLCYLSASGSARGDIIGRVSTTITLPGSLVLFVHFLNNYFSRYRLIFIKKGSMVMLYTFYSFVLLVMFCGFIFHELNAKMKIAELGFFVLLLCTMFFLLIRFYVKYKNSEGKGVLKILGVTFFIAFTPFIAFYGIPNILLKKEFISAEITATFLIVIPLVFFYLQLAEKLFDIEFLLNRLRYYSLLSLPFTTILTIVLSVILDIGLLSRYIPIIFLLLFISTNIFLYMKEYFDYKLKHHLFSRKNNFETSLYKFFQKAKDETKVNSLILNLMNEIREVLMVKEVLHFELLADKDGGKWRLKNKFTDSSDLTEEFEREKWEHRAIGSLIETMEGYCIVIGGDFGYKSIIYFGMKRYKTNLNIQERIWLETLAYFSSILLENFQLIEGLFQKIEDYKEKKEAENSSYPAWLSRLLFSLSEKERANLSSDLHDSVLQEQLRLLRDVDTITGKVTDPALKDDLYEFKESLLDNIHLIRETCNELRPPFLSELGIIQSIQNLIEQTKLRSNFMLSSQLDQSIHMLDKDSELAIYRVVQELFNNAMKHSMATEVKLALSKNKENLTLSYQDNGVGMDMTKLNDSFKTMGLAGIKERIRSIGGKIEICSSPGNGIHVSIHLKTGGESE